MVIEYLKILPIFFNIINGIEFERSFFIIMDRKRFVSGVTFLCAAVYFISYITRINYGSIISEIVESKGITNTAASAVVVGGFITYGAGQLLSGYMGDKLKPVLLIFFGLMTSVAVNFLMPLAPSVSVMTVLWCINGVAQAFMWPPLVKYLTSLLSNEEYTYACVKVSWGSYIGTIAVYLFAPIIIKIFSWQYVFYIFGALGFVMAFVWLKSGNLYIKKADAFDVLRLNTDVLNGADSKPEKLNKLCYVVIAATMAATVLQGSLRDGITTWMPTYIKETYNVSGFVSILSGVILPLFAIGVSQAVTWVYVKRIHNEFLLGSLIFFTGSVSSFFLFLMCSKSAALSVFLSGVVTASMHGVNLILTCMIPQKLAKYGKVSFLSGLINSCTYVGSAISGYAMALISQYFGWQITILSWAAVAVIGAIICFSIKEIWNQI